MTALPDIDLRDHGGLAGVDPPPQLRCVRLGRQSLDGNVDKRRIAQIGAEPAVQLLRRALEGSASAKQHPQYGAHH